MQSSMRLAASTRAPLPAGRRLAQGRVVSFRTAPARKQLLRPVAAWDFDWSDPDTQLAALGGILGLALGIGAPVFYASRDKRDEERLEDLRSLNRATKAETGEYLSDEEIQAIRPVRWTDRREFQVR